MIFVLCMALVESADEPLVAATWALVLATVLLACVGGAAARYAYLAYKQARSTDEFTRRDAYRDRFMEVHYPKIGGANVEGNIEAEGKAMGWTLAFEAITFMRDTVEETGNNHPDPGVRKDAQPIGNQIVRDAFADFVAGGNELTQGRTETTEQMRLDFEAKMKKGHQNGGVDGTTPHPDFTLDWQRPG